MRVKFDRCAQLRKRLALGTQHLHDAQARQDAIARLSDITEDDMTRLLSTEAIPVLTHAGIHILITHSSGLIGKVCLIESAEQAEVAHDGGNDGTCRQTAVLVKVNAADIKDKVAINDVTAFIDS